jgi:hypothetical protein
MTVASNYWSSTSNANNPSNAWNVNFNNGNVNNNDKSNTNFVIAVRGARDPSLRSFGPTQDGRTDGFRFPE